MKTNEVFFVLLFEKDGRVGLLFFVCLGSDVSLFSRSFNYYVRRVVVGLLMVALTLLLLRACASTVSMRKVRFSFTSFGVFLTFPNKEFTWDQDKDNVYVTIPNVPKGLRGTDIAVKITRDHLTAGLKVREKKKTGNPYSWVQLFVLQGQKAVIDGPLRFKCSLDDSTWGLDTDDNKLEITLVKHIPQEVEYWPSLLVGGREIDVDLIEGSKYLDRSLLKKVKASKQQQKQGQVPPEAEMK
jgi:hypothetical protein